MVKAIVGANWGDEGKGKITDMFAEQADVVIRFQGREPTQAIPSSTTMAVSRCTPSLRVFLPQYYQYHRQRRCAGYPQASSRAADAA